VVLGRLTREAVEQAIFEFDRLGRDAFLEKYGFRRATRYALEHEGRTYDPKAVAGVAYGFDHPNQGPLRSEEFSGGIETNRALRNAGFHIVRGIEAERHELRDHLEEFLATYGAATAEQFSGSHPAQERMRKLVAEFQASEPVAERPTVVVRGSTGQGNWARAPWIAFLDNRETSTTLNGVYPVLLFREDMAGAYLTLAQGTTKLAQEYGRVNMRKHLAATAREVAPHFGQELSDLGFTLGNDIQLGEHNLARNYQDSTIVHKFYGAKSVPKDLEILADLDGVLDLFDRYFSSRDRSERPREQDGGLALELIRLLQRHHNLVLEGVPGTGKSHAMEMIAARWRATTGRAPVKFGSQRFTATVMHPSTSYEDFIEGLRPTVRSPGEEIRRFDESAHGDGEFKVDDGFFLKACIAALHNPDNDVLVLLDELNRCNIPSVLGDLLLTLESSKRASQRSVAGRSEWVAPISVALPYSGRSFFVPDNLYVVATTNTTDRSVAPIDAAIRRRFAFVRLEPDFGGVATKVNSLGGAARSLAQKTLEQLVALNDRVLGPCLGPDALLGHSYCYELLVRLESSTTEADARAIVAETWRFTVIPQLIDSVRTFGAEDLLAFSTRGRWFDDHGIESDGADNDARSALDEFDVWMEELGLILRVEGTGLSRGARVQPLRQAVGVPDFMSPTDIRVSTKLVDPIEAGR
jgi:hypothetical protein